MAEAKCKVCDHQFPLTETFCPECGFERHVLPETVPVEVKEYEENRVKRHREILELQKKLKSSVEMLSNENNSLKEERESSKQRLSKKIAQLEKDLNDAQQKAASMKNEKPKAFLLIEDDIKESVGAVYEGRNTYGCFLGGIRENNHQEINIEGLKPLHFSIEAFDDHFRFFDLIGDVKSGKKPISDRGVSLHNGGKLEIGTDLTITFIIAM